MNKCILVRVDSFYFSILLPHNIKVLRSSTQKRSKLISVKSIKYEERRLLGCGVV
jgi:hypothetical protein